MKPTFEFCALQYLEIWYVNDQLGNKILNNKNICTSDRLEVLKDIISFYRVGRTIKKKDEEERYSALLKIIDKYEEINLSVVTDLNSEISKEYWKTDIPRTLSLTTKILWVKSLNLKIKIFDSRAKKALSKLSGKKEKEFNDYNKFVDEWNKQYCKNGIKSEIENACEKLPDYYIYGRISEKIDKSYILGLNEKDWFRERVFDIYLWNLGG